MTAKQFLFPSLTIWAVLALIHRAFAKSAPAKPVSNSDTYEAIDACIEEEMRRLKMPGVSLVIVEGNQIVHQRDFGKAHPGGESPTLQTSFFIGSLTKSFTAMAVMQLVEAGKIQLDAPVQWYLPWFKVADPQASAQITVRHLLNQTSGLPTTTGEVILADFDDSPGVAERQARELSTLVLTRPAGAAFEYSNSNYTLLGLVIEAATGESYAEYLNKHILNPLGMRHTVASQAMEEKHSLAVGHRYWFGIPLATDSMPVPPGALAGGGLISTAADLALFMMALLNGGRSADGQILSTGSIEEMYREAAEISVMGISLGQYGMGWFIDRVGQTKLVWHAGTLPSYFSFMALLPEQKKGVVLLFNACHHWMNPVLTEVGSGAAALLAGEQPEPAPIPFLRLFPWALRGQALIPVLQIAGVATTLRQLRRWRLHPEQRPSGGRKWGLHFLLPLIPDMLIALALRPLLGRRRDYLRLYMPDYSLIAAACGSFALAWSLLRTGLVVGALKKC